MTVDVIPYQEIIEDLNQKACTNYKWRKATATRELIKARWNEGFTLEDFKMVHSVKVSDWFGSEWAKYLRPSTLYRASKFEGYLNQRLTANVSDKNRKTLRAALDWANKGKGQCKKLTGPDSLE